MSATAHIERELIRDPSVRNCDLAARYGCSNALVSRVRDRLGLPLHRKNQKRLRVVLPAYMLEPLGAIAAATGSDVTIEDVVAGALDDLIAEHRT